MEFKLDERPISTSDCLNKHSITWKQKHKIGTRKFEHGLKSGGAEMNSKIRYFGVLNVFSNNFQKDS